MTKVRHGLWLLLLAQLCCVEVARAADVTTTSAYFKRAIGPVVKEFCLGCHSTEKHKGDLDLERFSSIAEVKKHPKVWQQVIEQLSLGEMPPKDKPQPTLVQREQLVAWVNAVLDEVALARAGDPGPVVLRRLSNAEYTYTIRDLTGVESLDPAREFPADGAAGEGFMNVGNALVMSPSLITKSLDAGKEIASHAVLLPDGIRLSPKNTRRDWTEEILGQIRRFYRRYTIQGGGSAVNLQGIRFDTKDGGILPLERYLAVLLEERNGQALDRVLRRGLSEKYLKALRDTLERAEPSILLDPIRARFRAAHPEEAPAIATEIGQWQRALWKFNSVGHIGKAGGPKAWLEPLSPIATRQEVRLKLSAAPDGKDLTLYLVASDAGDGNENDFVLWERPRLVAPGRRDLLLRDLRNASRAWVEHRQRVFAATTNFLAAAAAQTPIAVADLAGKHGVEPETLGAWLDYLGLSSPGPIKIDSYLADRIANSGGYGFIQGWGKYDTPNLVANSSDQHVRIPGNMKAHGIAVHPSPKLATVVGWRSPVTARLRVQPKIQHAHPECGNGVTWALELRRGSTRQRLAHGIAHGATEVVPKPVENLNVRPDDLISVLIGPRDGNHSCDLTTVDLTLSSDAGREWDLAKDVSPDVLAGNPHADSFGIPNVWHFYTEPDQGGTPGPEIPAGSLLARWQAAAPEGKSKLAEELQRLLMSGAPAAINSPDSVLYRQLASFGGPLFRNADFKPAASADPSASGPGLDPAQFGKHPNGSAVDQASLCVRAPSVIEVRLPADFVAGCEFVTRGALHREAGTEGSVQLQVLTNKPASPSQLVASAATAQGSRGTWTDADKPLTHATPIIVNEGGAARKRIEADLKEFRQIFPAALCYTKIVPVDEVVTLTLFHREDHHFARLMLDDGERAKLDRLWEELHYVSQDALTLVDVFEQLWQYATQDADPKVFEPMREPIKQRAAAFRESQTNTQPKHVEAVLEFAERAYRRPLDDAEKTELSELYRKLRKEELAHEQAIRLVLARVLVAPAFLYRAEKPGPGKEQVPVNDWELASRLSYFLWSSMPDAELRALAAAGKLREPESLVTQTRRMLRDARVRRLATEFGCAWLHIHGFDELGEKSERHFPTFTALRGAMYEESIRFFTDLFQNDRAVLNILDADYTFLNEDLAKHYEIAGVKGAEWRRVDGVKKFSRGGILAHATTLAKQSGASRTSPILRGNWVSEVLLGEKLPRPPKDVPQLPEDEATESLTVRQLTEKHSTDARCAGCHARIDAFGFALEKFDAIGRARERDLGGRPIDTRAKVLDSSEFEGIEGLRDYLLTQRRDAFLKQFCRKLLGYALGRGVQLSDGPLINEMLAQLKTNDHRVSAVVEAIVLSKQFLEIRGKEMASEE
ncbi:MAG: DUF1592 domain-containing protein [Verrucomicrobia subdivision 3 bacterium]|nr:DUF1592 domain-containing protein [Limisphaerales bacterium]